MKPSSKHFLLSGLLLIGAISQLEAVSTNFPINTNLVAAHPQQIESLIDLQAEVQAVLAITQTNRPAVQLNPKALLAEVQAVLAKAQEAIPVVHLIDQTIPLDRHTLQVAVQAVLAKAQEAIPVVHSTAQIEIQAAIDEAQVAQLELQDILADVYAIEHEVQAMEAEAQAAQQDHQAVLAEAHAVKVQSVKNETQTIPIEEQVVLAETKAVLAEVKSILAEAKAIQSKASVVPPKAPVQPIQPDTQTILAEVKAVLAQIKEIQTTTHPVQPEMQAAQPIYPTHFVQPVVELPDRTTLCNLALEAEQQERFFAARRIYRDLIGCNPNDMWIREAYENTLDATQPEIVLEGFYSEQDQKALHRKKSKARLDYYGGRLIGFYPANDYFQWAGKVIDEYVILRAHNHHERLYSFSIQGFKCGFEWNYNPCLHFYGNIGVSHFSKYHESFSCEKNDWLFGGCCGLSFIKNCHRLILETISDVPETVGGFLEPYFDEVIVSRCIPDNRAEIIARQALHGLYEYDFGKRRVIGGEIYNVWYCDELRNQLQRGSVWVQVTPPCYWENIALSYQFDYGRFTKKTDHYYAFQPQTTHWLKLELSKNWCADRFAIEAGYWYGWQRSFELGQIIVVVPGRFHWVDRGINYAFAKARARITENLSFEIDGTYSHDTHDFATWEATGSFGWRF